MKTIFLSGPMRGVPRSDALAWRVRAGELLSGTFGVLHALRGREERETFSDPRAAVARDLADLARSDILLVNDTVRDCSMIGTSMEIFYAHGLRKPVIVFGDAHAGDYWMDGHMHLRVGTLEEACRVLNELFS